MRQQMVLGKRLRHRYVDELRFLSPQYERMRYYKI